MVIAPSVSRQPPGTGAVLWKRRIRLGRGRLWPNNLRYHTRMKLVGFLFTLPVLAFFLIFNIYPIVSAIVISFHEFDLFGPMTWVGLENYQNLAGNKNFWSAMRVTLSFTLFFGPPAWVMGFVFASLIREKLVGRFFFRSVFFAPTILSAVAMATAWSLLLRQNGPLNAMLGLSVSWLTKQNSALWGIVIMSAWQGVGWFMVVFLAGLQSIPQTFYEAAAIDGAGRWRLMRHITLPMLRPVFAFVVIHTIIAGMKVFTPMFIMTGGAQTMPRARWRCSYTMKGCATCAWDGPARCRWSASS